MMLRPQYEQSIPGTKEIAVQRILTTIAFFAAVFVTIVYSFGITRPHVPTIQDISDDNYTFCSPNAVMTFDIYVSIMFVLQTLYLVRLLATKNEALLIAVTRGAAYHFVVFCLLYVAQIFAWTRQRFVVMELLLICNVVNLGMLYLRLGPTPHWNSAVKNIYVQLPLVKLPLAFTLVWLLQNSFVLVEKSQIHVGYWRYIPLWVFTAIVMYGVVFVRDSLLGLAMTYLLFSIGTKQYIHGHNHGGTLQFVFAFVLASVMFFTTAIVGVPRLRHALKLADRAEARPLLGS